MPAPTPPVINLGVLAHVDAGKTSLTERLLHAVGVIDELGSVDAGSTRTDTLALERRRGITIRSAVVSFDLAGTTVDLIDTPGHPDFIAEVERVLGVLDAVVLVVSAVEGVQSQTRLLMRTLQRLRMPTLLFVNKIDRAGARGDAVVEEVRRRLTPDVVPLGTTHDLGTPAASYRPHPPVDPRLRRTVLDVVTGHDDRLLADYLADRPITDRRLATALAEQTARGRVHPLLFGSARTGAGIGELLDALTAVLPAGTGDPSAPAASGTVFKVERGPTGEKLAWVRMYDGTLRVRDRLVRPDGTDRVTAIDRAEGGGTVSAPSLAAGRIGRVHGLHRARIGDPVGVRHAPAVEGFAPPTLETVVDPVREADRPALHTALTRLTEQDPLVGLRVDDERGELAVTLYGEVQKEVLADTLLEEYGVEVAFRPTTMICVERVSGPGASRELVDDDANPFLAGLGLRVEPLPTGSGVRVALEVELGSMPPAFFTAVEDGVRALLRQGVHGWAVPDALVTVTSSQYYPRQSHAHATFDRSMSTTASDFRLLAPLVLMTALLEAGTEVLQPLHVVDLELPVDALGPVLALVARLRGLPSGPLVDGDVARVEAVAPASAVHALQEQLPHLTGGEGLLESRFGHYAPVVGAAVPERRRTDDDPRHRRTYLLATTRRIGRAVS